MNERQVSEYRKRQQLRKQEDNAFVMEMNKGVEEMEEQNKIIVKQKYNSYKQDLEQEI